MVKVIHVGIYLIVISFASSIDEAGRRSGKFLWDRKENLIFYDLISNKKLLPPVISTGNYNEKVRQSVGLPCSCQGVGCGCCAGMRIELINFNQRMCANATYVPQKFGINMEMYLNDERVGGYLFSGSNPPPFCLPNFLPFPNPMMLCVKMSNIHTVGTNIHFCMDWLVRIFSIDLFMVHFTCARVGTNGIGIGNDNHSSTGNNAVTSAPDEVFDNVNLDRI